jgi:hypothetical protein
VTYAGILHGAGPQQCPSTFDTRALASIEDDDYRALHAALPGYLKPLLLMAFHVPCRGEPTDLLMTQLDFKANEIVLNPGETKNGEGRHMLMFGPMLECLLMQRSIRARSSATAPMSSSGERAIASLTSAKHGSRPVGELASTKS